MLDCGVPWEKIREAFKFQTSKISALILDHEHGDHSKAVKEVAKAGIDVYLSKGTMDALNLKGHRYHIVESKKRFKVGTWDILPFDAVHDAEEPLGFLMASGKEKALYLIDSAYCKYRFKGLTLIAIGVNFDTDILMDNVTCGFINPELVKRILKNHMSLNTARNFFQANDMLKVQEIHLLHLSDKNSDAERFRREIEGITGRPVYV
jgi:phosphoribosyl 1,2-cyclic phosphodiesterase